MHTKDVYVYGRLLFFFLWFTFRLAATSGGAAPAWKGTSRSKLGGGGSGSGGSGSGGSGSVSPVKEAFFLLAMSTVVLSLSTKEREKERERKKGRRRERKRERRTSGRANSPVVAHLLLLCFFSSKLRVLLEAASPTHQQVAEVAAA